LKLFLNIVFGNRYCYQYFGIQRWLHSEMVTVEFYALLP